MILLRPALPPHRMSGLDDELLQVNAGQLLVGAQAHPESPGVTSACAPAIGVKDHAIECVAGVQLYAERFDLMSTRKLARGPVGV